jgi:hypothetical protein
LAHSLVFTPAAFAQLEADPFRIFRHFPFLTSLAEALRCGDVRTGDIPAVELEAPEEPGRATAAVRLWTRPELRKLLLLALRADQLARDRMAIAFVGQSRQVEEALEAAFFAVPTPLRPRYTFDTYFYKCNLVATYYWAIGELESPRNIRFAIVNTQTHQVSGTIAEQQGTPYERWVIHTLDTQDLDALADHKEHAYAVCAWLDGHADNAPLLDTAPLEVIISVFQVNAQQVQALLKNRLGEQLPPGLVNRLYESLLHQTEAVELFRQLRQGFALPQLVQMLYQIYETLEFRAPPHEEVQALGMILRHIEHRALRLLHACWAGQLAQLRQELACLHEGDYRQFVQTALHCGLGEPLAFLIPGQGEAFVELYLASGTMRRHSFVALVHALLAAGEVACLVRLAPYVSEQSMRELRTLEKVSAAQPNVPAPFRHAVSAALAKLPPPTGFKGLLHALLQPRRRRSGKHAERADGDNGSRS